ncbi:MAG TPA: DEAD/DEAH box helicase, partial [Myxococcota bacterium]|nr:DEAD/DEAH box helicase [Myxococcota bacterium]
MSDDQFSNSTDPGAGAPAHDAEATSAAGGEAAAAAPGDAEGAGASADDAGGPLKWRTVAPEPPASFAELRVSEEIARALADMGFTRPTPVQAAVYQPILDGYDIMVQSHTGSGKTVAFGMPLAELLNPDAEAVQALVLCPTRELALQVKDELGRLYAHKRLRATAIYGGAAMGPQLDDLEKGVQIVVGTPGRVLDHIRRGTLDLSSLRVLVFDEADEMMSMGFAKEVDAIVEACPKQRQGMLFSATIPDEIRDLGRRT